VFNAILYVNRTGIAWKFLPHDFPNYRTVYGYYAAWRDEGIFAQLDYDLTGLARVKAGRDVEPTAAVIDTQSVKPPPTHPPRPRAPMPGGRSWGESEASPPTRSACCWQ
jgi:transposase